MDITQIKEGGFTFNIVAVPEWDRELDFYIADYTPRFVPMCGYGLDIIHAPRQYVMIDKEKIPPITLEDLGIKKSDDTPDLHNY